MSDVKVQLPTGEVIWVRMPADDGPRNVAATDVLHHLNLADLRATIQGVSHSMRAALVGLRPDEVSIEFGLELALKTGKLTSVLAEASGSASITVTVAWRGAEGVPAVDAEDAAQQQ